MLGKPKSPVILLLAYPRSGGTIFSNALGALPNVVLVSEVNPNHNAKGSIREQLKNWFGYEIAQGSYDEMANAASEICQKEGKTFIIRDFSFIDFTPHKLNAFTPSKSFTTLNVLKDSVPIRSIAFVRNAYDVWISRGCPPRFSAYYLDYVKALLQSESAIFKYEDFCQKPQQTIQQVCEKTGLVFSESFVEKMRGNQNITGDVDLKKPSRGSRLNTIQPLRRKRLPHFLVKKAEDDLQMAEANQLLGYPAEFYDSEFENAPSFISLEIKWFLKRLFLKYPTDLY
jgi:hypothetical protein